MTCRRLVATSPDPLIDDTPPSHDGTARRGEREESSACRVGSSATARGNLRWHTALWQDTPVSCQPVSDGRGQGIGCTQPVRCPPGTSGGSGRPASSVPIALRSRRTTEPARDGAGRSSLPGPCLIVNILLQYLASRHVDSVHAGTADLPCPRRIQRAVAGFRVAGPRSTTRRVSLEHDARENMPRTGQLGRRGDHHAGLGAGPGGADARPGDRRRSAWSASRRARRSRSAACG